MRTPAPICSYFPFWRGGRNKGAKPLSVLIWISAARYWPAPAATIRSLHGHAAVVPSPLGFGCVDSHAWALRIAFFGFLVPKCLRAVAVVITGQDLRVFLNCVRRNRCIVQEESRMISKIN